MITLEEINSKTRKQLLEWTLDELNSYKKENEEAVAEEYNFNHLPQHIEILLDAVFQRDYLPIHGLLPSSHYVCQFQTIIKSLTDRLSTIKENTPLLKEVFAEFSEPMQTAHFKTALSLIEEMSLPEVISQIGLSIIKDTELGEAEEINVEKGITLIKKALELSIPHKERCCPKRYAYLLAELYCNAREDVNGKVPVDKALALDYLKQAAEHGADTAKDLLEKAEPIDELSQSNPFNQKQQPSLGESRHILLSPSPLTDKDKINVKDDEETMGCDI